MEWNAVESLFDDDFRELCGCQVVTFASGRVGRQWSHRERHSTSARTGQCHQSWTWRRTSRPSPTHQKKYGRGEYAAQTILFWRKIWTTVSQQSRESGDDPPRHQGPGSQNESCTNCRRPSRSASHKPGGDVKCGLDPLKHQTST